MKVDFKLTGFDEAELALRNVPASLSDKFIKMVLRDVAKPMRDDLKTTVPLGTFKGYNPKSKKGNREYLRGGTTKEDVRIKTITDNSLVKVLVGISKKFGKVGWRFAFLDLGTRKRPGRNYLTTVFNRHVGRVTAKYNERVLERVKEALQKGGFK